MEFGTALARELVAEQTGPEVDVAVVIRVLRGGRTLSHLRRGRPGAVGAVN